MNVFSLHLPELLSLMGTLVSGLALLSVLLKIWTKMRANRIARARLQEFKQNTDLLRIAKSLRMEHLDPVEREKLLRQIERLLQGLDKKTLEEVNESLYQRSLQGRVRYAESLVSKSAVH
jgi:response regulator of citrate/malate metabolism